MENDVLKRYGMLIDLNKCVGCYACQVTCKAEYNLSLGVFRCRVKTFKSGYYPDIKKVFIPVMCNQCEDPLCINVCEEGAIYKTPEGVVILDKNRCRSDIECERCYEVCPYNAIDINPYTRGLEKCDFCYARVKQGEEPVCVSSCMGKAVVFGDLNDKDSKISQIVSRRSVKAINPDYNTYPRVFYLLDRDFSDFIPLKDYAPPERPFHITHIKQQEIRKAKPAKIVKTSCSMCPSECGISVLVNNGIAEKIYGNPHALINHGTLCAKGASGLQLTYSPHRIKTPLIRTGERGEDRWKEVTWEEALDYAAKKLIEIKKKYGPESVFLDTGDMTDTIAYERIFRAFGTPHIYSHGSICDPNRQWGQEIMIGDPRPLPDIQRPILIRNENHEAYLKTKHDAKLVLSIGANPFVATRFNYMSSGIPKAKEENNCIYIVVDPSHTNSASLSDIWLPIIPGTDPALLATMLYYIIKNDSPDDPSKRYIDHDFIKKYTIGWPEFREAFLEYTEKRDPANGFYYFTPEWAEEKTGIEKGKIIEVSHLFGITKPASIEIGMHGTAHHTNGDVTSILMVTLCLITGNMDRPGGLVFISTQKPEKGLKTSGKEFLERTVIRKIDNREVSGKLSELHKDRYGNHPASIKGVLTDLPKRIMEGIKLKHGPFKDYSYSVKALIVRGGNPVITAGNTSDWINALTMKDKDGKYKLELIVFIDTHINVTGRYADIILPEAGYLERMGVNNVFTMSPELGLRDQVIKPLYESKTPYEIMIHLSNALIKNGDPDIKTEDFKERYKDEEDFINEMLSDAPGFYNIGEPLPYPHLPEGCKIIGTPDNPIAILDGKIIKEGELLTVKWLREHHGVAVWPTSYYRYRNSNSSPSGIYPKTRSKKFEFKFSYIEEINKQFLTNYPTTFYWAECKWNPKNPEFKELSKDYPFQVITGRVHHAMTMTVVCPYLSEIRTECMDTMNNRFKYYMPPLGGLPNKYSLPEDEEIFFRTDTISIPVFAFNRNDGEILGINTGDMVILETPQGKRIRGKVLLTEEIRPGVIKTAFGPGGQKASGIGFMNNVAEYTPNVNALHDPENFNHLTGTPGFGDIMVRVIKVRSSPK